MRRAAERVPPQMEALPDPTASVSYTNDSVTAFTLGSATDSELAFSWTQELPYPGKRRLAGDVARAEVDVSARLLDGVRLRVRAEVKASYAELFRLDRTTTIVLESRKLLESFLAAARARYESGEGILENVLRAQTELAKLDAELATLAQERRSAGAALNALLGRPGDAALGPALAAPRAEIPERADLESATVERSPEVLALRAEASRGQSQVDLAERNLKPDFMWGTAYVNRGGLDPMVMGMFGVRLPLYRKHKQAEAVAQSRYELEAARRRVEAGTVKALAEVRDLLARAEKAESLMRLYAGAIQPQAQSALEAAAAAYSVGRVEFLTLLEDFTTVLEYERDYEMQRAERITALAALEPLTGAEIVQPAAGEPAPDAGGPHE